MPNRPVSTFDDLVYLYYIRLFLCVMLATNTILTSERNNDDGHHLPKLIVALIESNIWFVCQRRGTWSWPYPMSCSHSINFNIWSLMLFFFVQSIAMVTLHIHSINCWYIYVHWSVQRLFWQLYIYAIQSTIVHMHHFTWQQHNPLDSLPPNNS